MPAAGSFIAVDSRGFLNCSRTHLGISAVLRALQSEVTSAADMAARVRCPEASGTLSKAAPLLRQGQSLLEASHLIFAERAKWAAIAERDPDVRKYLAHVMAYGPDAVHFMMISAVGKAGGLKKLAENWPTMTRGMTYRPAGFIDVVALTKLAQARASMRFRQWEAVVQREVFDVAHYRFYLVHARPKTSVELRLNRDLMKRFDAYSSQAKGWVNNADAFSKWVDGKWGLKGAGIGTIMQVWQDYDNPYLTSAQKARRAVVSAGSDVAIWAIAGMATLGCATFSGPGGVACGAAVLAGGLGASYVASKVIDNHWKEDKKYEFDEFRKQVAPKVWKERQRNFITDQMRQHPQRELEIEAYNLAHREIPSHDPLTRPEQHAQFERLRAKHLAQLTEAHREAAEREFYRQTHYPPKDPVDRLAVKEQDRAEWSAKMAEIRANDRDD